ncbi:MAG: carbon starvation CstA family protein [Balneolaceae bacterium]
MSGSWVAALSLILFAVGYRYYSKFLAEKIYRLNPDYMTPAHRFNDGVDYVPTNRLILWGHHFTSIAGAAPIVGPAIAVYWGWVPAMLWVVLGTLFAAGEGTLALITIVAIVTYFNTTGEFLSHYHSFEEAGASGLNIFVEGAAQLATGLMIPLQAAQTIIAVIVISFAATTLDTSVRLMRYILNELGHEYNVRPLTRIHLSTFLAVSSSAALVLIPEGPRGLGSGGYLLWPLFGTSNQLLAGISLLLITIWLRRNGRSIIYTLVPMIFILFMTL